MATKAQLQRIADEWSQYANEPVRVEEIGGTFYGFGSELATLRLYRHYGDRPNVSQGFSSNLGSFYFSLTPRF
jgi:hypothetical protein